MRDAVRAKVGVLAAGMLLFGTINTLTTKFQDTVVVGYSADGTPLTFKHPVVQSTFMFLGECLCFIPYFVMRWRRQKEKRRDPAYRPMPHEEKMARRVARIMAFALPALCDACGTTLMNVGLFFTYASVYQMLRGTLVLFAGAFTIVILRRRLYSHHFAGMLLITAGAALVGASSILYAKEDAAAAGGGGGPAAALAAALFGRGVTPGGQGGSGDGGKDGGGGVAGAPLFGDLLIVGAQAFNALQFILEEKFLARYKVPALLAVGIEGCWGLALCTVAMPVMAFIKGTDGLPIDDPVAAAREVASHGPLAAAVGMSVLSIACFNFFGISVTKRLSGAARATIDACRTLFIWGICVRLGWERFHALQVVGFVVLVCGSALYNELLRSCLPSADGGEAAAAAAAARRHHRHGGRRHGTRADEEEGGGADGDLSAPLLGTDGPRGAAAAAANGASPTPPPRGVGAASAPIAAAAGGAHGAPSAAAGAGRGPFRGRGAAGAAGAGGEPRSSPGSESDAYAFARSMRLGPGALFPSSLGGSVPAFLDADNGGSPSYYSSADGGGGSYRSFGPSSAALGLLGSYTSGGGLEGEDDGTSVCSGEDGGSVSSPSLAGGVPPVRLPGSMSAAAAAGAALPRGGGALLPGAPAGAAGAAAAAGGGGSASPGGGSGALQFRRSSSGGGPPPGRGGLATAMRRGGGGSGSGLADLAARGGQLQSEGSGSGGGGRPPPGRSSLAPRPPSTGPPPRGQQQQ